MAAVPDTSTAPPTVIVEDAVFASSETSAELLLDIALSPSVFSGPFVVSASILALPDCAVAARFIASMPLNASSEMRAPLLPP